MTEDIHKIVPRETIAPLKEFTSKLLTWNQSINLIAGSTEEDLWERHIVDSAQLLKTLPESGKILDLGSGGGLPALVIGIITKYSGLPLHIDMIEKDARKCAFLKHVVLHFDLSANVYNQSINQVKPTPYDAVTSRALADLEALIGFAEPRIKKGGYCVFPKGKNSKQEIESALLSWNFDYKSIQSVTSDEAKILKIWDIQRA